MVVAKHDRAHAELARQFHDREVEKEYVALVWGVVQAGRRIDAPIGRDPDDRKKMSARARRARTAVTRVTRAVQLRGVSLLHVAIATGRTHQIRVHLSAIGHPDRRRHALRRPPAAAARRICARWAATRAPVPARGAAGVPRTRTTGGGMEFSCPLPDDLQAVLDELPPAD